jgi:hypothetical protein
MALVDDVKRVCDRLVPLGWSELLRAVTANQLEISQPTISKLAAALVADLPNIDRGIPGFEDYRPSARNGIVPGDPSSSLLYHALASPRVLRDAKGALLRGYPTSSEIETIENYVFGVKPRTLSALSQAFGGAKLAVITFATEYRSAPDTADGAHADLVFSRTGIARIGTARPKYTPEVRGFWPEDENNPHGFRVVPARFSAWLAVPVAGAKARVMRLTQPNLKEKARVFWIPVHKLFDGPECIAGMNLSLDCTGKFFNMKLQRVRKSLSKVDPPSSFPFVINEGLAELVQSSEFGRLAVVPAVRTALVEAAEANGVPLTYRVPKGTANGFATYSTPTPMRNGREVHRTPAYVHARTKVDGSNFVNLNDEPDVNAIVNKGGYDALHYVDFTGEGWVNMACPQFAGKPQMEKNSKPAYCLLSAPDFFPSTGQRQLSAWSRSPEIPNKFRGGELWGVPPLPLSEERLPANLQLPASPFDKGDDTMTAVVGMTSAPLAPMSRPFAGIQRSSILPDDAAGVFAPGWDVSVDVLGPIKTGIMHLAAYGLGSPFPEDAKLCAALSTFWPAVAPDVYRTMLPRTGNADLRGTVAPLTDEEIGQSGSLPWDGVRGPMIVTIDGQEVAEIASFQNVDYVESAVQNRFSIRLLSRISATDYEERVLAAARVNWVLSGGVNIAIARTKWLFLSFRAVVAGDAELQQAQLQAGHILVGNVYRVDACFVGDGDPTTASPRGPRLRLLPLRRRTLVFVAPTNARALLKRATDSTWSHVAAE